MRGTLVLIAVGLGSSGLAHAQPRAVSMYSTGFLVVTDAAGTHEEPLPASPLGHGEDPSGCWVAPDGTLYAVGKQYTGAPGPDVGAVWKRTPKGAWSTVFRQKDHSFHSITGRAANNVVVGSLGGYVTFDGKAWTPHDFGTMVNYVWTDGKRLLLQDQGGTELYVLGRGEPKPIKPVAHDPLDRKYECAGKGVAYRLTFKATERP